MPLIIYGLVFILLLIISAFFIVLSSEQSEKKSVFWGLESVLFLVMMPKNDLKKDDQMQKEEKILISQMEQVIANFLYLKKPSMFQEAPSVSLGIAPRVRGTDIYVDV